MNLPIEILEMMFRKPIKGIKMLLVTIIVLGYPSPSISS